METSILSGLEASKALYSSLESRISHLKDHSIVPGLAAVLVGNNPASEIYVKNCLLYTSPSPRDRTRSRMPSSA